MTNAAAAAAADDDDDNDGDDTHGNHFEAVTMLVTRHSGLCSLMHN